MRRTITNTVYFLLAMLVLSPSVSAKEISFNHDVRPILSDRCFFCHGPDSENSATELRLDDRQSALDFLAIVPGKPEESELINRVTAEDDVLKMPPPHSNRTISPEEIETLRRWIAEGAKYEKHWSFQRIESPEPPALTGSSWASHPIDRFVERKMREQGLEPNPPADKATLLRRLSFDLAGLPPTLEELDRFLADDSPDAYEKAVDRLLASSAYGERMTSEWLDVARYSDTYGYQVDRDRYVWPWRDWVIEAFNRNLPYDEFITQQLAGDLLPNATDDQILATTFNRLHPQKVEGGSVPEEFRVEYVSDRTQTVATTFLGLTMECARCHTHKYDPIKQTEYYQLSSFFDNIDEAGLYSFFTSSVPTPTLLLADEKQKEQLAEARRKIEAKEQLENQMIQKASGDFEKWLAEGRKDLGGGKPFTIPGQIAHLDFESSASGANQSVPGVIGQAVKLTGDDAVNLEVGNFHRYDPFSISLWLQTPDEKERAVIFHRSRAWTDAGSRGYELLLKEGRLAASLIHFWPGNAISIETKEPIPTKSWLHVTVTYDGSSSAGGIQLWINGKQAETRIVRDQLKKRITGGGHDHITIGERFRDRGFKDGLVDEFRVFDRELTDAEVEHLAGEIKLDSLLPKPAGELASGERQFLRDFYLGSQSPRVKTWRDELKSLRKLHCELIDSIPEIMVMRESEEEHQTYLLNRGNYTQRAAEVESVTPDVLHEFPEDAPRNRLGLARWLTSRENPLTARVTVNRYWQMIFGQGLVSTPEDFGSQGASPTHPELLDWLAADFMAHDWDLKRFLKQIVMSRTYRQSSVVTQEKLGRDSQNRWLSRYPARRLPAEMLRDNALATSGLLVRKIGGPPVKPYELQESFKPTKPGSGEELYRRSLYTYWKRTAPAPALMTFDAAKRDVCQVKREKTSSPLQALVMMNGPQFIEAARSLAEQVYHDCEGNRTAAIERMFRMLTCRSPEAAESKVLQALFDANLEKYGADPDAASQYLGIGEKSRDQSIPQAELAALSVVANTLLNLDECMMQR